MQQVLYCTVCICWEFERHIFFPAEFLADWPRISLLFFTNAWKSNQREALYFTAPVMMSNT
jgi:hypothetical protein